MEQDTILKYEYMHGVCSEFEEAATFQDPASSNMHVCCRTKSHMKSNEHMDTFILINSMRKVQPTYNIYIIHTIHSLIAITLRRTSYNVCSIVVLTD